MIQELRLCRNVLIRLAKRDGEYVLQYRTYKTIVTYPPWYRFWNSVEIEYEYADWTDVSTVVLSE